MKNIYLLRLFLLICCSQSEDDSNIDFALDDFYSLRLSNGYTLHLEDYNSTDIYYPIVNDNPIPHIKEIIECIDFVTISRDQIQKTPHCFASYGCHIIKKAVWMLSIFEKRLFLIFIAKKNIKNKIFGIFALAM